MLSDESNRKARLLLMSEFNLPIALTGLLLQNTAGFVSMEALFAVTECQRTGCGSLHRHGCGGGEFFIPKTRQKSTSPILDALVTLY
jgi:hypothetical protein